MPKPTKVYCYARTLRREWGLTQPEFASLLPRGNRNRVSAVERGLIPPNAGEILAYSLIFGCLAQAIFPGFFADLEKAVLENARVLYEQLGGQTSTRVLVKRDLLKPLLARAAENADPSPV